MDLQRKNDLEKASLELRTAAKARNLPQLCRALDRALALQLDDDSVDARLWRNLHAALLRMSSSGSV